MGLSLGNVGSNAPGFGFSSGSVGADEEGSESSVRTLFAASEFNTLFGQAQQKIEQAAQKKAPLSKETTQNATLDAALKMTPNSSYDDLEKIASSLYQLILDPKVVQNLKITPLQSELITKEEMDRKGLLEDLHFAVSEYEKSLDRLLTSDVISTEKQKKIKLEQGALDKRAHDINLSSLMTLANVLDEAQFSGLMSIYRRDEQIASL